MKVQHEKMIEVALNFILPEVQKSQKAYKDISKMIVSNLNGEHQCSILWDRNEKFVRLLKKHNIPLSTIGKKEVILGNYYVRTRDNYYSAPEKLIWD